MVTLPFAIGQGRMVLFPLLAGEGGAERWKRGGSTTAGAGALRAGGRPGTLVARRTKPYSRL